MFGRTVSIDGVEVFVSCVPETPYSEVCRRAAEILAREEEAERFGKKYAKARASLASC